MRQALRILLVEDDGMVLMALSEILESLGHHVCATATTEAGAIAAAARTKPDLMIVDVNLSEGSGLDAVSSILGAGHIPHIFMSGAGLLPPFSHAQILQKPFREAALVHSMEVALE